MRYQRPAPSPEMNAWLEAFRRKFWEIEQRMGRGPTYSVSEVNELLDRKLQTYELLFRGRRYGRPPLAERCKRAIAFLSPMTPEQRKDAHGRVEPLLTELRGWFV